VKKILTAVLILLACAGAYGLYQEIRGQRADLKALKAADEKAQAVISEKEAAIAALAAQNVILREKDAAAEVVKTQLRADLAAKTAENIKLREELRTAPPETILAKTQEWLSTQEIWLRTNVASQVEAVFSLAAFRLNADALADRAYLKFTLVPSLNEQLTNSEDQNEFKAEEISNLETMVTDSAVIIDEKDIQLGARDDTIHALKKIKLWREVRDFGFGVLFAKILGWISGK
jgi:hypothetical protein